MARKRSRTGKSDAAAGGDERSADDHRRTTAAKLLYSSTASQEAILIPEEGVDFDAEMQRIEIAYLKAALRRTGGKKAPRRRCCGSIRSE